MTNSTSTNSITAKRTRYPRTQIPILIALCWAILLLSHIPTQAQNQPRSIGGGFYQIKTPTISKQLLSGKKLEISVVGELPISGALTVEVGDVDTVSVEVTSTFRADDIARANEMMSTSRARLVNSNDGLKLKIKIAPSVWTLFEGENSSLDLMITVPTATDIEINAPYFQVDTRGPIADLLIDETFEPVDIRGARGIIRIESRNSNIRISDLIGGFDIRTSNARIFLKDIEVTEVSANRARTQDGRLEIRGYKGPLQARTARADLLCERLQLYGIRNWIENSGGQIIVSFSELEPKARVDVRNSYEDIELKFEPDISAFFSLRTRDGKAIRFENLPHRIIDIGENKIEAESGAAEALVTVRAKYGGAILISGKN